MLNFSCDNEFTDSSLQVSPSSIASSGIDYSIISEAYIYSSKLINSRKTSNGFDPNLEMNMIRYLDEKLPEQNILNIYEDMISSSIHNNLLFKKNNGFRIVENTNLIDEVKSLNLSEEAESILRSITAILDEVVIDDNEEYQEELVLAQITSDLNAIKSSVNSNISISPNEKFILLESIEAYNANLPLLLAELSSQGVGEGRILRRILRNVATVVVNVVVGAVVGAVIGGPKGLLIGGVVGLVTGIYMIANNECYAAFCWPSGIIYCHSGNCKF